MSKMKQRIFVALAAAWVWFFLFGCWRALVPGLIAAAIATTATLVVFVAALVTLVCVKRDARQ